MDTIAEFALTISEVSLRKAVLSYFCQEVTTDNLIILKNSLQCKDPQNTNFLSYEEFGQGLAEGNMPILPREFAVICKELDPDETGKIQYKIFLDSVYITKMYLKELQLYNTLKEADRDGRGGVTISEMKQILTDFQFPEEALGAAFQAMLKADIAQIEPECIIDTEKFIQSLHKEFASGTENDPVAIDSQAAAQQ